MWKGTDQTVPLQNTLILYCELMFGSYRLFFIPICYFYTIFMPLFDCKKIVSSGHNHFSAHVADLQAKEHIIIVALL